ncbi:glycosyltransferase family 2 protein [Salinibacter altiplanensis]|uniref:glycosyltransferase family 2 protein n=1 Tax=Salinibacter altiplanensis TaxID=1803181 RepID=UPI000C9F510B|nr:glycosyltransferase family 2 protein [Salinibacter altiplanensis]
MTTLAIIPAFNEAQAIGPVVGDIPKGLVDEVVVVNNASTDATKANARAAGATVVDEPQQGYGAACLRGIEYATTRKPDIVVFLDGDYSDHPDEMPRLVEPIAADEADFVVGSRIRGNTESGALLPQARVGNRFACSLMRRVWGAGYTDLGPFRAIRFSDLQALDMQDETFGWTIEMQIRALEAGLRVEEVPVSYRRGIGPSKITGTLSGTVKASAKILWTIGRMAATTRRRAPQLRERVDRARTDAPTLEPKG